MKVHTHNTTNDINIDGTHLQGSIECSYDKLVDLFGAPELSEGCGDKVDAEWALRFSLGTVATIYNWKNGKSYCGPSGTPVELIRKWNVGGLNERALSRVSEIIEKGKRIA
jgi:hypothetical protein